MSSDSDQHLPHILGDRLLTAVWLALLVLTVVTILVARIHLGFNNILVAMTIATTKALLVIFFFMHMKYENRLLQGLLGLAFVVLAIFIGMTFFDVAYRDVALS